MTTEEIGRPADVESLLSRHRPSPVTVVDWEPVPPWAVARARLGGAERVIAKWTRPHANKSRTAGWRTRTELAALRFLADDLDLDLAPRALAADLESGLVLLEDLAPRTPLDRLVRADGAAAHAGRLAAAARARGTLHAATAGRAEAYHARRAALGPFSPAADRAGHFARHQAEGRARAAALGAPIAGGAERELAGALAELAEPGPFLALSNGDPEANNVLVHAAGEPDARLIDFEFAGFVHALHDAVCLHLPGPGWLSVRDDGLAAEYRRALARGVPEAADDRRALPRLAGWARHAAALLRGRWPDADLDLDALPPYTPRRR